MKRRERVFRAVMETASIPVYVGGWFVGVAVGAVLDGAKVR